MASSLLKINLQTPNHSFHLQQTRTPQSHLSFFPSRSLHRTKPLFLSIQCSLSSPTPPASTEEAILQAKTCLSTALEKALDNPQVSLKLKKLKQPRFRVEVSVFDDSPCSLSQLAVQLFGEVPINKKGYPVKILILWRDSTLTEAAIESFKSFSSNFIEHVDISAVASKGNTTLLNSADVAVFLAPEPSQLTVLKRVSESLFPKPVVIFNPGWGFEEESSFGELIGFVGSFEVIYSVVGLEVIGDLDKRKGLILKCVIDGVSSGEKWLIFFEERGEMKVVSKFKAPPSIAEVENVLYNVMAINSPIAKSVKFLKDLVSTVTGRK